MSERWELYTGEALAVLSCLGEGRVQCCITSPPYFRLRDYGDPRQLGQEDSPEEYVERLVEILEQVRLLLRDDGVLWLNLGDGYANDSADGAWVRRHPVIKPKDLIGIPWRVALALQEAGWWLRSEVIWSKTNPLPSSSRDRPNRNHEHLFLLSKSRRYHFDLDAIRVPALTQGDIDWGRLRRRQDGVGQTTGGVSSERSCVTGGMRSPWSVWPAAVSRDPSAHSATMPREIVHRCVLSSSRPGDMVLDPFCGSGTTGLVALEEARRFLGVELVEEYAQIARKRLEVAGAQTTIWEAGA